MLARNVKKPAGILEEEVMMVTDVGVEIGAAEIHHHLAQQSCLDELAQRIVDSRERHLDRGLDRFAVQLLGGDVPVTLLEQEPGQRQPLPGWPQMRRSQQLKGVGEGPRRRHGIDMGPGKAKPKGSTLGHSRRSGQIAWHLEEAPNPRS